MRHIRFYNSFNESLSSEDPLKMNVASTIDGYTILRKDDPTIPMGSESSIDKDIITDPKERFNYAYGNERDNETRSSLDSDNILRIRIGGRDFVGRSGGVTHILLRVPENFDYKTFEEKVKQIRHKSTTKSDVEKVIEEVNRLIYECMDGLYIDTNSDIDLEENYMDTITEFINPIKDKIGSENIKKILLDIIKEL